MGAQCSTIDIAALLVNFPDPGSRGFDPPTQRLTDAVINEGAYQAMKVGAMVFTAVSSPNIK